jgi:predicted DCC family thiol-disulfide oxidoreductase YuxK
VLTSGNLPADGCEHCWVILLYDAECGFCRWAVVWALDRDRAGVLEPIGIQSARGAALLADLDERERLSSVHVVRADGSRRSGGAALAPLLEALTHPALARLARLVAPLTGAAYRFVAGNRRQFSHLVSARAKRRADQRLAAVDAEVKTP